MNVDEHQSEPHPFIIHTYFVFFFCVFFLSVTPNSELMMIYKFLSVQ